jgi:hypothetical protein
LLLLLLLLFVPAVALLRCCDGVFLFGLGSSLRRRLEDWYHHLMWEFGNWLWLIEKQSMRREGRSCEEVQEEEEDVLLYGRRRKDRRRN